MFPNIPKKTTAMIQVWVSVLLIVLALVMSFMPIIKINTEDLQDKVEDFIGDEGVDLDELNWDELPDEVEITAPKFISSVFFFIDFASEAMDGEDEEVAEWFEEKLEEKETQESLTTAFAIVSIFSDAFDSDVSSDAILPMIFTMMVSSISLLYVIVMILVLPIILLIKAIIALVQALVNLKHPEEATSKVGSKLTGLLSIMFMIMLFQCALPQVTYGWGAIALLSIITVSIVMNTIAVRLPAYRKQDFMYANLVQGISLVGIVGFLVFFFNLIKTGILSSFLKGPLLPFIQGFYNIPSEAETDFMTDVILMIVYVVFAFIAINYISGATSRFSLSSKGGASFIAFPILSLPLFILPTIIKSSQNLNVIIEGETVIEASSLYLSEEGETALTLVLVGIIIMFLAELAYLIVPKIVCKDMTKEDKELVRAGKAPDPAAIAAAPAEETPADAPVDEAAPTEETPAEEAPAEETSAE